MNFYILHILDSSLDRINLYNVTDKNSSKRILNSISDLEKINDAESLLVLLPSSEVTSYPFNKNESLSEQINIANFISDVDKNFVDSVSDNEYFLKNDAAFVVNKVFLDNLNEHLSNLNYKVFVTPEYLINLDVNRDVITEIDNKFIFSYKNNHGFSVNKEGLNQYLDLLINDNPNYNPKIFSSNKELNNRLESLNSHDEFNFVNVNRDIVHLVPNFFKVSMSLGFLIKKMNFSRTQILTTFLVILFLLVSPYYLIQKNIQNTKSYQQATFNIFNSISADINRVVAPKNQIDQILKNIPENIQANIELPNFELLFKYGEKYISDISIDITNSSAKIKLNSMPIFQFNILKTSFEKLNISILKNGIEVKDGSVNGILILEYKNV
jgi:mRNA-degrading endonuclease HigB of HigAB toxin-antitoxin module